MRPKQVKTWFEIEGVSEKVRDHFSKRRKQILEIAGKDASPKELAKAALQSRQVKGHLARDLLHSNWQRDASGFGLTQKAISKLLGTPERQQNADMKSIKAKVDREIDQAVETLSQTESHFTSFQVMQNALQRLQDGTASFDMVRESAKEKISQLQFLGKDKSQSYYTTKSLYETEAKAGALAKRLTERREHTVERTTSKQILNSNVALRAARKVVAVIDDLIPTAKHLEHLPKDYSFFNAEQKAAFEYLTVNSGAFAVVSGRAGSGKTSIMSAAADAWKQSGLRVVGTALSGQAAQNLATEAGIDAETVRMTLMRLGIDHFREIKTELKQAWRTMQGKDRLVLERFKLDSKTVLIVDEATMVGTRDLTKLLEHARKAKAKVVLVGDHRQLPSIDAGTPFIDLLKEHDGCVLESNQRQKTTWLKEAVDLVGDDRILDGLSLFGENDRLKFGSDRDECIDGLIRDWEVNRTKKPKDSVLLAELNEDVAALNEKAQAVRRKRGELTGPGFAWAGTNFRKGDRIAFHSNDRRLGLWNGDLGTILKIKNPMLRKATMVVQLDNGKHVTFKPQEYDENRPEGQVKPSISLGYAISVHKSQGMTVDKSFVLLSDNAITSKQSSYVSLSRARHDVHIWANSKMAASEDLIVRQEYTKQLAGQLNRNREKQLAHQLEEQLRQQRLQQSL